MSNSHLVFFFLNRQFLIYRYPPNLWKFNLYHYTSTKEPTPVTVFTNWNKSEENFHFYKTQFWALSVCFAASCYWGGKHAERPLQAPSLGTTLSTELPGFWTVPVSICAFLTLPMTVTKMWPKEAASLLFHTTWLRKKDTPFLDRWGNLQFFLNVFVQIHTHASSCVHRNYTVYNKSMSTLQGYWCTFKCSYFLILLIPLLFLIIL